MSHLTSHLVRAPILIGLMAACLLLALPAGAQSYNQGNGWEDVGPMEHGYSMGGDTLMAPPPVVQAATVQDYRPPVEPPADMLAKATRQAPQSGRQQPSQPGAQAGNGPPTAAVASGYAAAGPPRTSLPDPIYVIQAGDTLPKIALDVLGNADRWQEIAIWNNLKNPNQIQAGQVIRVSAPEGMLPETEGSRQVVAEQKMAVGPARQEVNAYNGYETVEPEMPATVQHSISADAAEADASYFGQTGGTYTIQRGDTLGIIAKNLLGSTKRWREIARANPGVKPERLVVGQTIQIPGIGNASNFAFEQGMGSSYNNAQISFDSVAPLYSAPVLSPPPPPPPAYGLPSSSMPYAEAPNYGGVTSVAPGGNYGMTPPPPPAPVPSYQTPSAMPPAYPQYSAQAPLTPPPFAMPEQMGAAPLAPNLMAPVPAPIAVGAQELYREDRYRIPDELKPTDFYPYFPNLNGAYGLFETESAFIPYLRTWYFGTNVRYDKYRYLNGRDSIIEGRQIITPVNIMYAGKKLFAGLTIPFQSWGVRRSGGSNEVKLTGLYDPEVKVGYQIWKNLEGEHAVTLHLAGRFPSRNFHQPIWDMSGKSSTGVRIGPTNATRGAWSEFGAAYSGKMSERWNSHLNFAFANDSEDSLTRYMYRGGVDYRVNHNFSLVMELNGTAWYMDQGPDGANVDLLLGLVLFNEHWQGTIGFPMSLQSKFGYGNDFGFCLGVNHRWD